VDYQGRKQSSIPDVTWLYDAQVFRFIFDHGFDFAAAWDCFVNAYKCAKALHGKKSESVAPFHQPWANVRLRFQRAEVVFGSDPFESRLASMFAMGADEARERELRARALDERLKSLFPDGRVPEELTVTLQRVLQEQNIRILKERTQARAAAQVSRPPLFCLGFDGFDTSWMSDAHMCGRDACVRVVRALEPESPYPDMPDGSPIEYDTLWARRVVWRAERLVGVVRDFPLPYVDMRELSVCGLVVGAEEEAVEHSKRRCDVYLGEHRPPCTVFRKMPPLKYFHDLDWQAARVDMTWGVMYELAMGEVGTASDLISKPSLDPSPPLLWWDKLRLVYHGRQTYRAGSFHLRGLATRCAQATRNYMETVIGNFLCSLTPGTIDISGDMDILAQSMRTLESHCMVHIPSIRMLLNFEWDCQENPMAHRLLMPFAPEHVADKLHHDTFARFRSHGIHCHQQWLPSPNGARPQSRPAGGHHLQRLSRSSLGLALGENVELMSALSAALNERGTELTNSPNIATNRNRSMRRGAFDAPTLASSPLSTTGWMDERRKVERSAVTGGDVPFLALSPSALEVFDALVNVMVIPNTPPIRRGPIFQGVRLPAKPTFSRQYRSFSSHWSLPALEVCYEVRESGSFGWLVGASQSQFSVDFAVRLVPGKRKLLTQRAKAVWDVERCEARLSELTAHSFSTREESGRPLELLSCSRVEYERGVPVVRPSGSSVSGWRSPGVNSSSGGETLGNSSTSPAMSMRSGSDWAVARSHDGQTADAENVSVASGYSGLVVHGSSASAHSSHYSGRIGLWRSRSGSREDLRAGALSGDDGEGGGPSRASGGHGGFMSVERDSASEGSSPRSSRAGTPRQLSGGGSWSVGASSEDGASMNEGHIGGGGGVPQHVIRIVDVRLTWSLSRRRTVDQVYLHFKESKDMRKDLTGEAVRFLSGSAADAGDAGDRKDEAGDHGAAKGVDDEPGDVSLLQRLIQDESHRGTVRAEDVRGGGAEDDRASAPRYLLNPQILGNAFLDEIIHLEVVRAQIKLLGEETVGGMLLRSDAVDFQSHNHGPVVHDGEVYVKKSWMAECRGMLAYVATSPYIRNSWLPLGGMSDGRWHGEDNARPGTAGGSWRPSWMMIGRSDAAASGSGTSTKGGDAATGDAVRSGGDGASGVEGRDVRQSERTAVHIFRPVSVSESLRFSFVYYDPDDDVSDEALHAALSRLQFQGVAGGEAVKADASGDGTAAGHRTGGEERSSRVRIARRIQTVLRSRLPARALSQSMGIGSDGSVGASGQSSGASDGVGSGSRIGMAVGRVLGALSGSSVGGGSTGTSLVDSGGPAGATAGSISRRLRMGHLLNSTRRDGAEAGSGAGGSDASRVDTGKVHGQRRRDRQNGGEVHQSRSALQHLAALEDQSCVSTFSIQFPAVSMVMEAQEYQILLDVIRHVLIYSNPVTRAEDDRRETIRYALELGRVRNYRNHVLHLQSRVRHSLQRVRHTEYDLRSAENELEAMEALESARMDSDPKSAWTTTGLAAVMTMATATAVTTSASQPMKNIPETAASTPRKRSATHLPTSMSGSARDSPLSSGSVSRRSSQTRLVAEPLDERSLKTGDKSQTKGMGRSDGALTGGATHAEPGHDASAKAAGVAAGSRRTVRRHRRAFSGGWRLSWISGGHDQREAGEDHEDTDGGPGRAAILNRQKSGPLTVPTEAGRGQGEQQGMGGLSSDGEHWPALSSGMQSPVRSILGRRSGAATPAENVIDGMSESSRGSDSARRESGGLPSGDEGTTSSGGERLSTRRHGQRVLVTDVAGAHWSSDEMGSDARSLSSRGGQSSGTQAESDGVGNGNGSSDEDDEVGGGGESRDVSALDGNAKGRLDENLEGEVGSRKRRTSAESRCRTLRQDLEEHRGILGQLRRELHLTLRSIREAQQRQEAEESGKQRGLRAERRVEVVFGRLEWQMLDTTSRPVMEMEVRGINLFQLTNHDESGESKWEIGDVRIYNVIPEARYPLVFSLFQGGPRVALIDSRLMLRVFLSHRAPVGGLTVMEHFEVNLVPVMLQLTARFVDALMEYFFPRGVDEQAGAASVAASAAGGHSGGAGAAGAGGSSSTAAMASTSAVGAVSGQSNGPGHRAGAGEPTVIAGGDDVAEDVVGAQHRAEVGISRTMSLRSRRPMSAGVAEDAQSIASVGSAGTVASSSGVSGARVVGRSGVGRMVRQTTSDEVKEMKVRAQNVMFAYVKVPGVVMCLSYKADKDSVMDFDGLVLKLPTLEYHHMTVAWKDLWLQIRKDVIDHAWSQVLMEKLRLRKHDPRSGLSAEPSLSPSSGGKSVASSENGSHGGAEDGAASGRVGADEDGSAVVPDRLRATLKIGMRATKKVKSKIAERATRLLNRPREDPVETVHSEQVCVCEAVCVTCVCPSLSHTLSLSLALLTPCALR
jgi:hypothetical protein